MKGQQHSERLRKAWRDGKYAHRRYVRRWDAWTIPMDAFLKQYHAKLDIKDLVKLIVDEFDVPRTQRAVETRLSLLNLIALNLSMTASQIAHYLGVDGVTVASWIKRGIIKGEQQRVGVSHSIWQVKPDDFIKFIEESPEMYDLGRMPTSRWRGIAEVRSAKDPLYPLKDLSIRLGVSPQTLRELISAGQLRAVPKVGQKGRIIKWFILRSQLMRFLDSSSSSVT